MNKCVQSQKTQRPPFRADVQHPKTDIRINTYKCDKYRKMGRRGADRVAVPTDKFTTRQYNNRAARLLPHTNRRKLRVQDTALHRDQTNIAAPSLTKTISLAPADAQMRRRSLPDCKSVHNHGALKRQIRQKCALSSAQQKRREYERRAVNRD